MASSVDETYVRVEGRWCYLYRAIGSTGATIDFLLSALPDAAAAKRLFRKALSDSFVLWLQELNKALTRKGKIP